MASEQKFPGPSAESKMGLQGLANNLLHLDYLKVQSFKTEFTGWLNIYALEAHFSGTPRKYIMQIGPFIENNTTFSASKGKIQINSFCT